MIDHKLALDILKIKAKEQVYTLLSGNNLSKLHGEGYDLSEIREYQIGDDVRKINWMITAKMGKPYIKELHANRELSIVVSTMMDGSLYFGKTDAKQQKLAEVVALLGYASLHSGDTFSAISHTDRGVRFLPPTKEIYSIDTLIDDIYNIELLESSISYRDGIEETFRRVLKPSLIFVVGDFLQEVDLSLLAQKHEVIAIIIRDQAEEDPQKLGEVILHNPTDGKEMTTYFGQKSVDRYLTRLKKHDEAIIKHFSQQKIRYQKIYSNEDAIGRLIDLFNS
ncbi:hypothetical protein MNB_SV-6-42 [hydrothermal vent metagenome]|uniref:DUF58 domain-containing protein n=1 Tax=hydrothermal vent metagenome TaxID=652676 RepID=A0A1W1BIA8_9ZZZZ